jgi:hypothetical protein
MILDLYDLHLDAFETWRRLPALPMTLDTE